MSRLVYPSCEYDNAAQAALEKEDPTAVESLRAASLARKCAAITVGCKTDKERDNGTKHPNEEMFTRQKVTRLKRLR